MKRISFWLMTLALCGLPAHAREKIEGAWELSCITPVDSVENADPGGVINSKWIFDGNGRLQMLQPDQTTAGPDDVATYSIHDGQVELVFQDGSRRYLRNLQFPNRGTMRLPRESGGYSQFRRIPSATTLLEPRSLQRVVEGEIKPGHECDDDTRYDKRDYASLPLHDRLQGTWEVVMYRNLSPRGVPPYGYSNDINVFDTNSLIVHSTANGTDKKFSYVLREGVIYIGDMVMTPSFNQWSQLILTNDGGGQIYLKRLSRNTGKPYPKLALKVVWIGTEPEPEPAGKRDKS